MFNKNASKNKINQQNDLIPLPNIQKYINHWFSGLLALNLQLSTVSMLSELTNMFWQEQLIIKQNNCSHISASKLIAHLEHVYNVKFYQIAVKSGHHDIESYNNIGEYIDKILSVYTEWSISCQTSDVVNEGKLLCFRNEDNMICNIGQTKVQIYTKNNVYENSSLVIKNLSTIKNITSISWQLKPDLKCHYLMFNCKEAIDNTIDETISISIKDKNNDTFTVTKNKKSSFITFSTRCFINELHKVFKNYFGFGLTDKLVKNITVVLNIIQNQCLQLSISDRILLLYQNQNKHIKIVNNNVITFEEIANLSIDNICFYKNIKLFNSDIEELDFITNGFRILNNLNIIEFILETEKYIYQYTNGPINNYTVVKNNQTKTITYTTTNIKSGERILELNIKSNGSIDVLVATNEFLTDKGELIGWKGCYYDDITKKQNPCVVQLLLPKDAKIVYSGKWRCDRCTPVDMYQPSLIQCTGNNCNNCADYAVVTVVCEEKDYVVTDSNKHTSLKNRKHKTEIEMNVLPTKEKESLICGDELLTGEAYCSKCMIVNKEQLLENDRKMLTIAALEHKNGIHKQKINTCYAPVYKFDYVIGQSIGPIQDFDVTKVEMCNGKGIYLFLIKNLLPIMYFQKHH